MLRTWLVGILKHKLVDQVRRHTRECHEARHDDVASTSPVDAEWARQRRLGRPGGAR